MSQQYVPPTVPPTGVDPLTGLPYGMNAQQASAAAANAPGNSTPDTTALSPVPTTPGAPTADMNAGLAPLTGFAKSANYTPLGAMEAFENPWNILLDLFPGLSTSNPMYQQLRDFGADPLTLYSIMSGSQRPVGAAPQGGDFINWLANFYEQMATPGGKGIDASTLIQTIFGQKVGDDKTPGAQNALKAMLAAGGPSDQIRILFNLLRDVSNVGMDPLQARGYQAAIAGAGDRYGNAQMKADPESSKSPTEWIAANMPWLAGR